MAKMCLSLPVAKNSTQGSKNLGHDNREDDTDARAQTLTAVCTYLKINHDKSYNDVIEDGYRYTRDGSLLWLAGIPIAK